MKRKRTLQQLIPTLVAGIALTGSTALAATAITNNFNTAANIAGWEVEAANALEWASGLGPDGSGVMKVTLKAADPANKEADPFWLLPTPISSADYAVVEYDVMIDPSSGTDATSSYGNWQEVLRNAAWSWDSHWVGALNQAPGEWVHRRFAIPNTAKTWVRLGFQLQGTAPYNADVVFYIDNLVITPFYNPLVFGAFKDTDEVATWSSGNLATITHSTMDAGGNAASGSMKVEVAYTAENTGWQEGLAFITFPWAIDRYTFLAFDLYVENPSGISGWGHIIKLFTRDWDVNLTGDIGLNASHEGKWTHFEIPLPGGLTPEQLDAEGIRIQIGGSLTSPATYYIDNVQAIRPNTPPKLALKKAGPAGVSITMDQNGSQWQREAIVTPADASGLGFFWTYQTFPLTYSWTVSDFPDPAKNPGFETHMYIVNADTDGGNETAGDCDWGASDIIRFRIQNGDQGGVWVTLDWKTNLPNANPPGDAVYNPIGIGGTTMIGTWSLTFTDINHGFISGPGIPDTSFELPLDAVQMNFAPATSFLQFGMFKNDWRNDGKNDQATGTISAIKFTGASFPFDEKFNGTSFTSNYAWRKTKASAVNFVPPGTAWWLSWTLPADGYYIQSAPSITGPWNNAGLTSTNQVGAVLWGTVPTSALPSPDAVFFRAIKP